MGARRPHQWDDRVRAGCARCRAAGRLETAPRRRGQSGAARSQRRIFPRIRRSHAPPRRHPGLCTWPALRADDLRAAQKPARPRLDARDFRADLRDLQDLPAAAGQVPPGALVIHRRDRCRVFRVACGGRRPGDRRDDPRVPAAEGGDHSPLQSHRHRRQLWRGVVRHPREHVRELADGLRQPAWPAVSLLRDSAQGGHEHRHDADQRRAAADVVHPAVRAG